MKRVIKQTLIFFSVLAAIIFAVFVFYHFYRGESWQQFFNEEKIRDIGIFGVILLVLVPVYFSEKNKRQETLAKKTEEGEITVKPVEKKKVKVKKYPIKDQIRYEIKTFLEMPLLEQLGFVLGAILAIYVFIGMFMGERTGGVRF
jgi:hypothetical protein